MSKENTAWHRIVSDQCRENKGDTAIVDEMADELREKLADALDGWDAGDGIKFHLKLVIERP